MRRSSCRSSANNHSSDGSNSGHRHADSYERQLRLYFPVRNHLRGKFQALRCNTNTNTPSYARARLRPLHSERLVLNMSQTTTGRDTHVS